MKANRYRVVQDHTSEYPEPITFEKGAPLVVGKTYVGPEGWENWVFCETPGQKAGWVPTQIIEEIEGSHAHARENYTARELNVKNGDLVTGERVLNGWVWCQKTDGSESGWVPLEKLREESS